MLNNVAIDVALGLIFIFLLYSLLASIFQELLARMFDLRSRNLMKALRRMLEDGDGGVRLTLVNFFVDIGNNLVDYFRPLKEKTFLKGFYDYPTIKYLGENSTHSKPSYIDADNFSTTVIHLLRGEGYNPSLNQMQVIRGNLASGKIDGFIIKPQTLKLLTRMWTDSQNDVSRFKLNLEIWFNQTMQRATGWYKKQTQLLLFLVGWVLAWQFNVDPIAISKILANNEGPRKELLNLIVSKQKRLEELVSHQKDSIVIDPVTQKPVTVRFVNVSDKELSDLAGELGTDASSVQQILGLGPRDNNNESAKAILKKYQKSLFVARIGWLLAALAISLGASFWFDLLNKIMLLRNAGPRPLEKDGATSINTTAPPITPVG